MCRSNRPLSADAEPGKPWQQRRQNAIPQEREQLVAMIPKVLGQPFVGRICLGRPDQVNQLVLQAAAGHGQTMPTDLSCRVSVTQVQAGS